MAPVVGRIRKKATFRALARPDGRARRGPVSVDFCWMSEAPQLPVVAYAIGRRHGGAVVRNRLRRRLRAAVRAAAGDFVPGSYLLRTAPSASALGFDELRRSVGAAARAAVDRATHGEGDDEGRGVR
jgi:ribonuclease P protein component